MLNCNAKGRRLRLAFVGMKGLPPDRPGAGGGERETDAKARRLAARGFDVTVYCRRNYCGRYPEPYCGIRLISLPSASLPGLEMLTHTFLSTLHIIFINRAEIINYHGMGNALFLPLAKIFGKKSVIYMDGIDWERPKWGIIARMLLKWAATFAFRWGDVVYVDTASSKKRFTEIFGREPLVITLGAELWESPGKDELAQFGLEPDKFILFVGMLQPDKGVHLLVEAYSKLITDFPLVIVGDNPNDPKYVRHLKEKSDVRVKFLGYQYSLGVQQLFGNCLIYVQPSLVEGNSPALMSAMACGRCVVVNGIEQNRETIGETGIAFEAGQPNDLRRVLAELLANRSFIAELGRKARRRIETVYNWDKIIDQLINVYQSLSRSTPAPHKVSQ